MRFNRYDAVPEWARFLTLEEFRAFLAAIERDLVLRGLRFEDRSGILHILVPGGTLRCGLANVALKCGSVGRDAYLREVAAHFDRVLAGHVTYAPFPESFDEVRDVLRVRVYTDAFIGKNKVVSRRLAPGLQAVAVYDLSEAAASIYPDHLKKWKTSPETAFQVALDNTANEKWKRDVFEMDAAEAFGIIDTGGYAASQVLLLEKHLPPSRYGAIVAMPCRHVLICYPIKLTTVVEALRELVPRVDELYQEPPDNQEASRLSSNLFWWRGGKMESMGAGMDLAGLPGAVIAPPQEFIDTVMAQAAMLAPEPVGDA